MILSCAVNRALEEQKFMCYSGADVDATDKGKWTALMYAARYGHEKVVAELVVKGGVCLSSVGNHLYHILQHA